MSSTCYIIIYTCTVLLRVIYIVIEGVESINELLISEEEGEGLLVALQNPHVGLERVEVSNVPHYGTLLRKRQAVRGRERERGSGCGSLICTRTCMLADIIRASSFAERTYYVFTLDIVPSLPLSPPPSPPSLPPLPPLPSLPPSLSPSLSLSLPFPLSPPPSPSLSPSLPLSLSLSLYSLPLSLPPSLPLSLSL